MLMTHNKENIASDQQSVLCISHFIQQDGVPPLVWGHKYIKRKKGLKQKIVFVIEATSEMNMDFILNNH